MLQSFAVVRGAAINEPPVQDKINAFWEITKKELEDKKAELRNKDREMEEMEERHQVEIKVYKQKVKHLLYEHQNNLALQKADVEYSLKLQSDEFKARDGELDVDKRRLKQDIKEHEFAGQQHVLETQRDHAKEITKLRQAFELQVRQHTCAVVASAKLCLRPQILCRLAQACVALPGAGTPSTASMVQAAPEGVQRSMTSFDTCGTVRPCAQYLQAKELQSKYEKQMKLLRDDLELQRKQEVHQTEERKNAHIRELMRKHRHAFTEIKNYYNDITSNNLDLIKTLKEDVAEMKKKEALNEKLMYEISNENKRLSEPLNRALKVRRRLSPLLAELWFTSAFVRLLRTGSVGAHMPAGNGAAACCLVRGESCLQCAQLEAKFVCSCAGGGDTAATGEQLRQEQDDAAADEAAARSSGQAVQEPGVGEGGAGAALCESRGGAQ